MHKDSARIGLHVCFQRDSFQVVVDFMGMRVERFHCHTDFCNNWAFSNHWPQLA